MLNCSNSEGKRCSACLRLQDVQSKIHESKEPPTELYIQEAHTKSSVNAAHDLIICHLPLELVSNIFIFCNPHPIQTDDFGPSLSYRPWSANWRYQISLGMVCTAWRNIVRSTPQLWTTICIRLQNLCESPKLEFVLLCLQLSGSLPLHIYAWVPWNHEPDEDDYPTLISLLEALNFHSERWKTLDLSMTPRLILRVKCVFPTASTLEHLRIDCDRLGRPGPWFDTQRCVSFGLSAPRVVNAYGIPFPSLGVSWRNVTHVKLDALKAGECLTLFQQAMQLVDLVIFLLESGGSNLSELGEVVTAPNLISWRVEFEEDSDVLLRKICLPSLVHLDVDECTSLDSLEHLVSRSNCPLRTIHLGRATNARDDVIPIFRVTPLLEKIVLSHATSHGIHKLLEALARTKLVGDLSQDPHTVFLPLLESLSFMEVDDYPPPWHLVPSLFPPTQQPVNVQYRPLRRLEFRLSIFLDEFNDDDYLDMNVVRQLMEIKRRDYNLVIQNDELDGADGDLIQLSYSHHFGSQTPDEVG